jgi:hypothetical protein
VWVKMEEIEGRKGDVVGLVRGEREGRGLVRPKRLGPGLRL